MIRWGLDCPAIVSEKKLHSELINYLTQTNRWRDIVIEKEEKGSGDCCRGVAKSWNPSMISVISTQPFWDSLPTGKVDYQLWDPLYVRHLCEYLWVLEHKQTVVTWICRGKPKLSSNFSFWDFLFPLTLLYGNQSSPNPLHLFQPLCYSVGWSGLDFKGLGLVFFNKCSFSRYLSLASFHIFFPRRKTQGEPKRYKLPY